MFLFAFWCPDEGARTGCVERVIVEGQFAKPSGQINQQTGQPIYMPDQQAAGKWAAGQGLPYPGCNFKGAPIGRSLQPCPTPKIIAIQYTMPQLSAAGVNAGGVYGPPYGNGGVGNMPPPPEAQAAMAPGQHRQGLPDYEPIHAAGLPNTQDSFLDIDPQGGTFTDISPTSGVEEVRNVDIPVPYDPTKVPGRR